MGSPVRYLSCRGVSFEIKPRHANPFGIISDGKNEHMMLYGAVGDFTKSLVSNLPTHLWVRQVHFVGLPYLANMYDRVLLVTTGSGPCKANVCVLWIVLNMKNEVKEAAAAAPEDVTQGAAVNDDGVRKKDFSNGVIKPLTR